MDDTPRQGLNLNLPVRQAVVALDEAMGRIPMNADELRARRQTVESVLRALQARGVDGEALVRYGMAPRIAITLLAQVLFLQPDEATPLDLRRWREVLRFSEEAAEAFRNPADDRTLEEMTSVVGRLQRSFTAWIENAPMIDLLLLAPPTSEDLDAYELLPSSSGLVVDAYTWLWQRSVVNELDRWSTESLVNEFRWQEGEVGALFSDELLDGPRPDKGLLAMEVARRLTRPVTATDEAAERLFWQLQDQASEHLSHRRYTEATALFDFFHRLHPDHPRAINNLGFCWLPVDPATALHHLRAAERKGYRPRAINVYNQACALVALDRPSEAFDRLEYYWQHERSEDGPLPDSVLWHYEDGEWTLEHIPLPLQSLCVLGEHIATALGRADRTARWSERGEVGSAERDASSAA